MTLSNLYKSIVFLCTLIVVLFCTFLFSSKLYAQEVSLTPRFITNVGSISAYPLLDAGDPGVCIISTFDASAQTSITYRRAPFETIENPDWTFFPSTVISTDSLFGINVNLESVNQMQPGEEYIFQFLEIGENGTYHIITPQNQSDDIITMCTPNLNGTLDASCPFQNTPVLTNCSSTQPSSSGSSNTASVSTQIVTPFQNTATVTLNTQSMPTGTNLNFVYTTDLSHITGAQFGSASFVPFTTNGSSLNIQLNSLQPNSTYYFSVITNSGQIVFAPQGNQLYSSFSTTNPSTTSNGSNSAQNAPNPATINVNLEGTFGQTELAGENIEAGFTQCGYGDVYDCDFNQLLATVDRIIKFLLYVIVLPIAAILFAFSGIKLIIARSEGKAKALSEAKAMFGRVLLGLVFAFGAWVIIKFVLVILGYTDASGLLTQILGITTTQ